MTKNELLDTIRQQITYLNKEYGVMRIGVFGSFSHGKATDTSDVDIVVEFERPIGLKFVDFSEYLEKIIGRKTDILTPAGINGIRNKRISQSIRESITYV